MVYKSVDFKYVHGDTYNVFFSLPKLKYSSIDQIYYTVKTDQNAKPLVQKKLDNGITLLSEDEERYHYILSLNCTCTDNLKINTKYLHDIEVVLGDTKKTVLKGTLMLEEEATTTKCER